MADIYAVRASKVLLYDGANPRAFVTAVEAEPNIDIATVVRTNGGVLTMHLVWGGGERGGGAEYDVVMSPGDYLRPGGPEVIPAAVFVWEWSVKV